MNNDKIEREELKKMIRAVATNFKFKLDDSFEIIFNMIFEQVKNLSKIDLQDRFLQILLTSHEDWVKKYPYGGYPCLNDWVLLLTERKLLNKDSLEKLAMEWSKSISYKLAVIKHWLSEEFCYVWVNNYKNQESRQIVRIINLAYCVSGELEKEEIIDLFKKMKSEYLSNESGFNQKIMDAAIRINPAPTMKALGINTVAIDID